MKSGLKNRWKLSKKERFKIRTTVERANAYLKDWLIPDRICYRSDKKIAFILMNSVLVLTALKIIQNQLITQLQSGNPMAVWLLELALYNFNIRFYTTRNSFIKKDREVIQSLYVFETENDFSYDFSPTKQTWLKITDRKILPAYKWFVEITIWNM